MGLWLDGDKHISTRLVHSVKLDPFPSGEHLEVFLDEIEKRLLLRKPSELRKLTSHFLNFTNGGQGSIVRLARYSSIRAMGRGEQITEAILKETAKSLYKKKLILPK
jgi:hypothetical protein